MPLESTPTTPKLDIKALQEMAKIPKPEDYASPDESQSQKNIDSFEQFQNAIDYDPQSTQEALNNEINSAQYKNEISAIEEGEVMPQATQRSYYQKVRNTGIGYFDNKKELGFFDAYLAKKLGLDTKYVFHKIDITSDNTHRVQNYRKTIDNIVGNLQNAKDTIMLSLQMGDKGTADALKKMGMNITGGFLFNDKNYPIAQQSFKHNLAYAFNNGRGQVLKADNDAINDIVKPFENQAAILGITARIIDKSLNNLEAQMSAYQGAGASRAQMEAFYTQMDRLKAANEIIKDANEQKRPFSAKETLQLMQIMSIDRL